MKTTNLSATTLRGILIAGLLVLIIGGTAGFLYLRTLLVKKADETAAVVTSATSSDKRLQALQNAERTLDENASVEQKVNQMVLNKSDYEYQDTIILNILAVAKKAGVNIQNINYTEAATGTTSGATASSGGTGAVSALPGGISTISADITFESPLRYDSWLAFVHYIETNTMQMEIANVSITSEGATPDGHSLINSDGFKIGVYVKQ